MADIFVSYGRKDRDRVQVLAAKLKAHGWSVWWDREILAGKNYSQVIERELDAARAVIVAWSSTALASDWVGNEAAEGLRRGVLIPVLLEDVRPPLEFRRIQAVSLFDSPEDATAFDDLIGALTALLGRPAQVASAGVAASEKRAVVVESPPASAPLPPPRSAWHRLRAPLLVSGLLVILLATYFVAASRRTDGGRPQLLRENTVQPVDSAAGAEPAGDRSAPPGQRQAPSVPVSEASRVDPAAAAQTGDAAIRAMVLDFLAASETGDLDRVLTVYGDQVDYFGQGVVGKDFIAADKRRYYRRWPVIAHRLEGDVVIEEGSAPATRLVRFGTTYDVRSPARKAHAAGRTENVWIVQAVDGALKVINEKQRVISARSR